MSWLRDPGRVTAGWLLSVVAAVMAGTALSAGDARALLALPAVVLVLLVGWYVHMRIIDPSFGVEICLRPLGRIRL